MLYTNHQVYKTVARVSATALFFCLSATVSTAAQTEIQIWGETITVLPDDRVILQLDGKNYRLPNEAEHVPAQPIEQVAIMHIGAAGDLAHMAAGVEVKLETNLKPVFKRNCFVHNRAELPGFGIPSGLTQADADYLTGCIVASISFGPGVESNSRFLNSEKWNEDHLISLSKFPPRIVFPDFEATPLTVQQAQEILVIGTAIEAEYFWTHLSTGPDVQVLFETGGPLFGPGRRLMECDGGYGTPPKIFGHSCRISAMSMTRRAYISVAVYCPCEQDLRGLISIEKFLTDRLKDFVGSEGDH